MRPDARIVAAVRRTLVLLLLIAAAVHPFAHLSEETVACPCVHGVVAELAPPSLEGPAAASAPHAPYRASFFHASLAGEVPARAPPAAA